VDELGAEETFGLVMTAEHLWTSCVAVLRTRIADAAWKTWFETAWPVEFRDGTFILGVPNGVARERIESRYGDLVRSVIGEVAGRASDLVIEVHTDRPTVDIDRAVLGAVPDGGSPADNDGAAGSRGEGRPPVADDRPPDELPLNPKYSFDAFVIGASNRFAHAAALSVAETPARSYNPLFIYGGAGLGKTHLLHAIGHYVRENYQALRVRYVSTETFLNEFVDAIRTNTTTVFKRRYRECDVLLVDDVQFMENKEGLQEEFFHTFNTLHGSGRQIVISSDRPPRSIATLEDRLRSRFEWGLITDVQPPELETRLAILRKKAEGERTPMPSEVLEYIATHITQNIRELEGALIRISAFASLNREPLTHTLAERVLGDLITSSEPRPVTPRAILEATSEMFEFSADELCGKSRSRPLVTARQISMYVFREMTDLSYPAIAREFGGRDHTTVIHAVDKIATLMKEKRSIYEQVTELTHRVKSRA
jgi:chromosomal replication initiator protein